MSAVYDPLSHGLSVGPWRSGLPDWQIYYNTYPVPRPPYSRGLGTLTRYGIEVAGWYHTYDIDIDFDTGTLEPVDEIEGINYAFGASGFSAHWGQLYHGGGLVPAADPPIRASSYEDNLLGGVTVDLDPQRWGHFAPEWDWDPSDPAYSEIWDDPDVVGVELENGYVYLYDPEGEKESVLTPEQYQVWNPDWNYPPGSGAGEYDTFDWWSPTIWPSITMPCQVIVNNSVDGGPVPGGPTFTTGMYPAGVGQVLVGTAPFNYYPTGDDYYVDFNTPGAIVYTGKKPNTLGLPAVETTVDITIPTGVFKHVFAKWSVLGEDVYALYDPSGSELRQDFWTTIRVLPPVSKSYLGPVHNPLRWRLVYGRNIKPNLAGAPAHRITRFIEGY